MRKATEGEESFADWVVDIDELGPVFVIDISLLAGVVHVSIDEPELDSVMALRRVRSKFAKALGHKTVTAHCDVDDEQAARLLTFAGFAEQRRDEVAAYFLRAPEPYT